MNTVKRDLQLLLAVALAAWGPPVWAEVKIQPVTVTVTVPSHGGFGLSRTPEDPKKGIVSNSSTRGSAGEVLFDKFDKDDMSGSGSASDMYAPYQSEGKVNWHVGSVVANGSSMTLSAKVDGTLGAHPLAEVLYVWFGGFWEPDAKEGIQATQQKQGPDGKDIDSWELLNTFTRTVNRPIIAEAPFSYRLKVPADVQAGPYHGTITYTMTSN